MKRRTFLLVPFALAAQPSTHIEFVWITGKTVPEDFARESVVFPRAYTCCPESGPARKALETGRFPHAKPLDSSAATISGNITILTAEAGDDQDSPFEHSIRVPLAIRWPGKLTPRVADDILISHADVLPTVLAWSGIPIAADLQGRDLSTLIERRQGELPDSIYVEGSLGHQDEWRAVVRGYDKIVFNLQEEVTHLYNLAEDPDEETNLAGIREHELLQDSMLALARRWRRKLGDGIDPSGLRLR